MGNNVTVDVKTLQDMVDNTEIRGSGKQRIIVTFQLGDQTHTMKA